MNFENPMSTNQGYIVYNLLLDYIDSFIASYVEKSDNHEYPSLRETTNSVLAFMEEFHNLEFPETEFKAEKTIATIITVLKELHNNKQHKTIDSKKLDLFTDNNSNLAQVKSVTNPRSMDTTEVNHKPLRIGGKDDIKWLASVGISLKKQVGVKNE